MASSIAEQLLSEKYVDDEGLTTADGEIPNFEAWEEYDDAPAYRRMITRWGLNNYNGSYGYGQDGHFVWEFDLDDPDDESLYEEYPEGSFSLDWDDMRTKLANDDNVVLPQKEHSTDLCNVDIKYRYMDGKTGEVYSIIMESDSSGCRLIAKRITKNND